MDTVINTKTNNSNVVVLPEKFHMVDTHYLIQLIVDMMNRLTTHNDRIPLTSASLTRFHSRAPPSISISDYLNRIIKYASVEKTCLLILLVYIDRACENNRSFTVSSLTVHRFIITSICVSSKAISDSYCSNSFYAKVGGISTKEINTLELELLFLLDWRLTCSADVLDHYYANLVKQHPAFTIPSPKINYIQPVNVYNPVKELRNGRGQEEGNGIGIGRHALEWVD